MKLFKKLLSYIIALTMVLSLATLLGGNVYAAGETAEDAGNGTAAKPTYTLTIDKTKAGHKYAVYKVFGGDLKVDSETKTKTLSNVVWGNGVDAAKLLEDLKADSAFTKDNSNVFAKATKAADVAEALSQNYAGFDSTGAKAFAKDVGQRLSTPVTFGEGKNKTDYVASSDSSTTITLPEPGYYFVKDQDGTQDGKSDAYTKFIVQVVGPAEVNVKSDVPSVEKKVKDKNDSAGTTTGWQDSADYDIGDSIPYKLTAALGTKYGDYKTYKLEFVDNLSAGLSYDDKVNYKVTVDTEDGADITNAFTKSQSSDGKTITWTCNDLKEAKDNNNNAVTINAGSKIIVTYNAKLEGDNVVIGSEGNPNTVYLKYSNNPNYTGEGAKSPEGQTPTDKNIVFTYKTVVNKFDQDGKTRLKGAGFTLKKKVKNEEDKVVKTFTAGEETTFEFTGLDDGDYELSETTTPAGYNTITPIEFTINATHDETSDDPKLTELFVNKTSNGATFTPNIDDGSLTTNVINKKGSTLPSTGGMGTTLLYVAGGILVACAAAYVVLNKKRA